VVFVPLAAAAPRKVFSLSSLLRRVHSPPRLLCRLCSRRCRCSYIPAVATARPSPFSISFLLERKGDRRCYIMIHGIFVCGSIREKNKTETYHVLIFRDPSLITLETCINTRVDCIPVISPIAGKGTSIFS
jgi:hypothetical protein